jgi:LPXTG-motif cell wall-anchored protein
MEEDQLPIEEEEENFSEKDSIWLLILGVSVLSGAFLFWLFLHR